MALFHTDNWAENLMRRQLVEWVEAIVRACIVEVVLEAEGKLDQLRPRANLKLGHVPLSDCTPPDTNGTRPPQPGHSTPADPLRDFSMEEEGVHGK